MSLICCDCLVASVGGIIADVEWIVYPHPVIASVKL